MSFSMILWAKAQELSLEEMTDVSYGILRELSDYGPELSPKFLPAMKKSQVKEFKLSNDNVMAELEKGVNKEGKRIFWELGRSISFFSSLDNILSSGISIHIGNSDPMFNNSIVIRLPEENFSGFSDRIDEFIGLFKKLVCLFNPYFAFVSNGQNKQLSNTFWRDNKPTYLHWVNYYDESTTKSIGINKVLSLPNVEKIHNGYFFKLQDDPIDIDNSQHLQKQKEITEYLGL